MNGSKTLEKLHLYVFAPRRNRQRLTFGLVLLLSLPLLAQQSNTVYAQIGTGKTSPNTFVIPSQYKIGQSGHQVFEIISGFGCNPNSGDSATAQLQGSYDQVNWVSITPLGKTSLTGTTITSGQGLFPFLQINITNTNTTNCTYNIYYGGSLGNLFPSGFGSVASQNFYSPSFGITNNGSVANEKSHRYAFNGNASQAVGVQASGSTQNQTLGYAAVIDCISVALTANAAVASGGEFDYVTISGTMDATNTAVPSIYLGLPSAAVAGTTVTRDVCGLNIASTPGQTLTVKFSNGLGLTNVIESLYVTYYMVAQ